MDEFRSFLYKLERRFGRSRLGFFIAPGGLTSTFKEALLAERKDDYLIVLIDHDALAELVRTPDRSALLKRFHERAVMALRGR